MDVRHLSGVMNTYRQQLNAQPARTRSAQRSPQMAFVDSLILSADSVSLTESRSIDLKIDFHGAFRSGNTDGVLEDGYQGGEARRLDGQFLEESAQVYSDIRAQIDSKFYNDAASREEYTHILDESFRSFVESQGKAFAQTVDVPNRLRKTNPNLAESYTHPVGEHKDFDYQTFEYNIVKKGNQFIDTYLDAYPREGASNALQTASRRLSTQSTTSVNDLSFTDLKLIMNSTLARKHANVDPSLDRYNRYSELADNPHLSDYMQSVFRSAL